MAVGYSVPNSAMRILNMHHQKACEICDAEDQPLRGLSVGGYVCEDDEACDKRYQRQPRSASIGPVNVDANGSPC